MEYKEVQGHKDLVREISSNAIINRNNNAYEVAKIKYEEAMKQRDEIRSATREINTLKCEIHEIKDMLTILLDRK
jgi:hypothetical protein|tara:strand:+ start:908 stop:1132 length:225 start_codon:yes stop_codon:yes gene_type:complete